MLRWIDWDFIIDFIGRYVMDNNEWNLAWRIVCQTGANLFLTGKAGTGKTTFLKSLKESTVKRMIVLAPTGIAAINAGGVTIHSFFQLPLSPYVPGAIFEYDDKKRFRFSKIKRDIIRTLDLLVIDEISMVRADLLDAIDSVMRRYREHNKPFGGVQLLMIGDLQQLAPVVKNEEWALLRTYYDTPYFFSSKALALATYYTIELKKVYRQQDVKFIELLNQIRDNKISEATLEILNRRYLPDFIPPKDSSFIRLMTHNYQAQAVNDSELAALPVQEYVYEAEIEGVFPEALYPAEKNLVLKQGSQIMFVKNDPDKRFFNGMIGIVVALDKQGITVSDKAVGRAFNLEKTEWTNSKYTIDDNSKEIRETVEGVFRQYPLRLAWAITVHKSQGLTFDHAIIDVSHSFAHGQAYVALSRCRTLEGIVLSAPLRCEALINDAVIDSFEECISSSMPTEMDLSKLKLEYRIRLLDEMFDLIPVQSSFKLLLRTIDEHFYNKYPRLLSEYKRLNVKLAELINVAGKFKMQYIRLVGSERSNPSFQERIHKAAAYFLEALSDFVVLLGKTRIETDNRTIKKQYDDRFASFTRELLLKVKLFEHESKDDVNFATADYLSVKARILLNEPENEKGKKRFRKTKENKIVKPHTREISFNMFLNGMSIKQIAEERALTVGTIYGHLLYYVSLGKINVEQVISKKHIDEIQRYIVEHPVTSVKDIKANVSSTITYDEIRFIVESFK